MAYKNYLYFAEDDVETVQDAMLLPSGSYRGCDAVSGGVQLMFESVSAEPTRDIIKLHCTNGNQKAVLKGFVSLLNATSGGMIVVADFNVANGQQAVGGHPIFNGLVTDCTVE